METQTAEAPGESLITSNGRRFKRSKYNGIGVTIDEETGYYNATTICTDNGKQFRHIATKKYWTKYTDALTRLYGPNVPEAFIIEITNVQNDLRGQYIHPELVNYLCIHIDYEYAIKVSRLMNLINERNKLTHQTLEQTINGLNDELEKLKAKQKQELDRLNRELEELKPKAEKADAIDNLIDAFNSNHENKLENTSTLEANAIGCRGERFIQTTWNGISVLKHERTGYYKASKACEDNGKRVVKWLENKTTSEYLKAASEEYGVPIGLEGESEFGPTLLYKLDEHFDNETRGYYIHPDLFHDVCYWANKRYALRVSHLMNLINERNKLIHQTLEDQIIELKDKNESKNHSLNELEAELVSRAAKIDELKAEIHDLTTPIDTRLAPPTAYAKVIGNAYFQLKVSSSILGPNVQTLRRESFVGAIDCVRQAKQELKRRGLIVNRNGTNVIARSRIDEVFDLLHQIKARQTNVVLTNRNEWLDEQIVHWRSRRQTAQSEGKLFELEYIRRHEELTPWALVPNEIKNELNEMVKDTGIDAVILDEKQITKIVQLKYKRTPRNREIDTIRMNELAPFISKCSQPRYQTMDKHLVLNGCRLGSHIRRALEAMHISVEVI